MPIKLAICNVCKKIKFSCKFFYCDSIENYYFFLPILPILTKKWLVLNNSQIKFLMIFIKEINGNIFKVTIVKYYIRDEK